MDENNEIEKDNIKSELINQNANENENKEPNNNVENNNDIQQQNIDINTNIKGEINTYKDNQNKEYIPSKLIDYLITIKYSKIFHIPYFVFRNLFIFYCPCTSFPSNPMKLSEMPTPPFVVIRSEYQKILRLTISFIIFTIPMLIIQFVCLSDVVYLNIIIPIVTLTGTFSSLINYIINPGIIFDYKNLNEIMHCSECKMYYPKTRGKLVHCDVCEICISGYDHHCDVIGKCVGKYNMIIFVTLAISGMTFVIAIFAIIIKLII